MELHAEITKFLQKNYPKSYSWTTDWKNM